MFELLPRWAVGIAIIATLVASLVVVLQHKRLKRPETQDSLVNNGSGVPQEAGASYGTTQP